MPVAGRDGRVTRLWPGSNREELSRAGGRGRWPGGGFFSGLEGGEDLPLPLELQARPSLPQAALDGVGGDEGERYGRLDERHRPRCLFAYLSPGRGL